MSNNIDQVIRNALQEEDKALFDQLDSDMNLQQMAIVAYQGKLRWIAVLATFWAFVTFVLAVYCAWQYFQVTDLHTAMAWAAGFGIAMMSTAMLKLYIFMEINKSAVLREVKRVELQLTRLAALIKNH